MPRRPTATRSARSPRATAALALAIAACATALPSAQAQSSEAPARKKTVSLIQRGSELFEDQRYEESIQTLSAALVHPGISAHERVEIYRLLAYNFIILKRLDEADASVRGLLAFDERYALPPTESPRFRDFFAVTRKKWEAEGKPGKVADATAPPSPIRIDHTSPAQVAPGTLVKLTGTIDDPGAKVRGVQLAYRAGANGRFVTVPATYALGRFHAKIPGLSVQPPLVEYYLQAVDQGGLPIAARGDAAMPLRIVVPTENGSVLTSPWFWVPVGVVVIGSAIATALVLSAADTTSRVSVRVTE